MQTALPIPVDRPSDPDGRFAWVERLSTRSIFLLATLVAAVFYVPTASLMEHQIGTIDTYTNVITAHTAATEGTFVLRDYERENQRELEGYVSWITDGADGPVSTYTPGTALHAVPLYLLDPGTVDEVPTTVELPDGSSIEMLVRHPSSWQASLTAALTVAIGMGFLALTFASLGTTRQALVGTGLAAFGTCAWSVAADELWQHGPGLTWTAAAMWFTSRKQRVPAAAAWAGCILIRPTLALIAFGVFATVVVVERSWRRAVPVAVGVGLGAGALMAFNRALFGVASISGGYGDVKRQTALELNPGWYLGNLTRALIDPERGLLVWSPFLVVLAFGLPAAWRAAPAWVRGGAIGGVLYVLFQYKAEGFAGGSGYFGYRYLIEPLAAAAPLWFLAWRERVRHSDALSRALVVTGAMAVSVQALISVLR